MMLYAAWFPEDAAPGLIWVALSVQGAAIQQVPDRGQRPVLFTKAMLN